MHTQVCFLSEHFLGFSNIQLRFLLTFMYITGTLVCCITCDTESCLHFFAYICVYIATGQLENFCTLSHSINPCVGHLTPGGTKYKALPCTTCHPAWWDVHWWSFVTCSLAKIAVFGSWQVDGSFWVENIIQSQSIHDTCMVYFPIHWPPKNKLTMYSR